MGKHQSAGLHEHKLAALTCPGAEVNAAIKLQSQLFSGESWNSTVNLREFRMMMHCSGAFDSHVYLKQYIVLPVHNNSVWS